MQLARWRLAQSARLAGSGTCRTASFAPPAAKFIACKANGVTPTKPNPDLPSKVAAAAADGKAVSAGGAPGWQAASGLKGGCMRSSAWLH